MTIEPVFSSFVNPPKTYSPVPIWWWSGERLDSQRLRWQLERFAEGGIYNLIVLNLAPTSPLYGSDADDPPFMSEAWWEIFLRMCEDARELGVYIWFYDQLGFSGANFQGEVVRENPHFAGQWLESIVYEGEESTELICPPEGIPLAAAVTSLDANGQPVGPVKPLPLERGQVTVPGGKRRRARLVYAVRRGFDYFNPEGCARLLDKVHGEFERCAGHLFGEVIVGSFQDELPSLATWGEGFASAFFDQTGYDVLPRLVELWDGRGPNADRLRADYHRVRASLAEEAFFKPLFAWHERHGLLCGFDQQGPARAGHPIASVYFYADYLRTHRWYTAPGSDHHGEAKIHSSLAHLYGRPRVWIEAFHTTGWGGTLEETFDWLLPWLRAGATLYDPHAVYYSTRGGWWEWAPPSTCWRQPYWRHYSHFSRAVTRLCYVLSQGHHVCDIGLLFPSTTVQAGLSPDAQPLPDAQAAHDSYQKLVGSMFWQNMQPGVLDRDRRDYDVIDEASLRRGRVEEGALVIGPERYRVLVLPGCRALEAKSAEKLLEFVKQGGQLVAVGALPELSVDGADDAIVHLRRCFADGLARQINDAEDLPGVLTSLPRTIDAPVPVLHRCIDGCDVVFVPATFPYATRQQENRSWLDVHYTFDPADYHRTMQMTVHGRRGTPELWDPFTGACRSLRAVENGNSVTVEIPFDGGPAALIVWPAESGQVEASSITSQASVAVLEELTEGWMSTLEPTIDNRFGDFARPAHPGAPPIQTWRFAHRVESSEEDGLSAGWHSGNWPVSGTAQVLATFGPQGWYIGPLAADKAPSPLAAPIAGDDPLQTASWRPVVYSLSRGVDHDPIHKSWLGPKGHVPEEFLLFGRLDTGQAVQFRTSVWMDQEIQLTFALGAPAAKRLWINGVDAGEAPQGYWWMMPVRFKAGVNIVEFRLIAEEAVNLRASWALVRELERYIRPEWMTTPDEPSKYGRLRFFCEIDVPFTPLRGIVQVGVDAPCRVLINGVEIGRQGGFDPYYSLMRVQPYDIPNLKQGKNRIELEIQDMGWKPAVVVDGIAIGAESQQFMWRSDSSWQVQRNDETPLPVRLRRRQWADAPSGGVSVDMDPPFSHLWRRPHPLPGAHWLEDSPADGTVIEVAPDPFAGLRRVEWLRWVAPPGAMEMRAAVQGRARVWIDGVEKPIDEAGYVLLGDEGSGPRVVVMRIEPARGCSGGRLLAEPVTYRVGTGRIAPGKWAEQGLESYSGGLRYRRTVVLNSVPVGRIWLDLGRVRGVAEARVNGEIAGVRVLSPYRFEVTSLMKTGENDIEIIVLNTLAPYLSVQSPTSYIFSGQCDSGLMGPIRLVVGEMD